MIEFRTIRYKNFFSYGNSWTQIELCRPTPTCIIGSSGSGKSVLLDAITFALYGVSHRAIKKSQIINSINNKDCLVEIEFKNHGKTYTVRRGIKPNVFEIYSDNELIDQEASVKEYQAILENDILQMDRKTFSQIVIISSTDYIPFMLLTAGARREFIESILDLKIFTTMKDDMKDRMSSINKSITDLDVEIRTIENKIEFYKSREKDVVQDVSNELLEIIQTRKEQIRSLKEQLIDKQTELESLESQKVSIDTQKLNSFKEKRQELRHTQQDAQKTIDWFAHTETCPTCSQDIAQHHKESIINDRRAIVDKISKRLEKADSAIAREQGKIDSLSEEMKTLTQKIIQTRTSADGIKSQGRSLSQEIKKLQYKIDNPEKPVTFQKEIEELEQSRKKAIVLYDQAHLNKEDHEICRKMLADDGIKESIIARYTHLINQKINYYLDRLGLFVSFNLDSEFNEVIKSRGRDTFSYTSFSMGERARIDISILLMFREIAKSKSRSSTNLLILDETFDGSLDYESCSALLEILNEMESSVIVISHNEKMISRFDEVIRVRKIDNFSVQEVE